MQQIDVNANDVSSVTFLVSKCRRQAHRRQQLPGRPHLRTSGCSCSIRTSISNTTAGGKRIGDSGYLVEPAVFADVRDDMSIATDEIFGPVQVRTPQFAMHHGYSFENLAAHHACTGR